MEDDGLNLIVSEPARIIYVLGPKCGSTGTVDLFLRLSGFAPQKNRVRALAKTGMADGQMAAQGLSFYRCGHRMVHEMRAKHPDFALFTNIRDPYGRALSNYYSKLNRYSRAFAPGVFRYGKLRQLLLGPKGWGRSENGNRFMQTRISFEAMLRGLAAHGPGFDPHFARQCDVIDLDRLQYDRMFRIETLDADLLPALQAHGVPDGMLARVSALTKSNASSYARQKDSYFSPEARALIGQIYAADFGALGYPLISGSVAAAAGG